MEALLILGLILFLIWLALSFVPKLNGRGMEIVTTVLVVIFLIKAVLVLLAIL